MHDVQLEDRLRAALRAEAESLPFSITAEQLERRLRQRHRDRLGRWSMTALAAGVALAVVGGSAVLLSTQGPTPPIGTSPSPSASPSESTETIPPASPSASLREPSAPLPEPPEIVTDPSYAAIGSTEVLAGGDTTRLGVELPATADTWFVSISCVGDGSVEVDTPALPIRYACEPVPGSWLSYDLVPPADRTLDLPIRTSGTLRARVVVQGYDIDGNPDVAFVPPVATVSAGQTVEAVVGCGLAFELASGESGADQCGADYPVIPLDRSLMVSLGDELRFEVGEGWTITQINGEVFETNAIIADPLSVSSEPLSVDTGQDEPSVAHLRAPAIAGDWTIGLHTDAVRDGSRFGVEYWVRIVSR